MVRDWDLTWGTYFTVPRLIPKVLRRSPSLVLIRYRPLSEESWYVAGLSVSNSVCVMFCTISLGE